MICMADRMTEIHTEHNIVQYGLKLDVILVKVHEGTCTCEKITDVTALVLAIRVGAHRCDNDSQEICLCSQYQVIEASHSYPGTWSPESSVCACMVAIAIL